MAGLAFLRDNARWLAAGFLLTLFSSFGQTFFISLSAGAIRSEYGLSHGAFGLVYLAGTLASAFTLPRLGQIVDTRSVRSVVLLVVPMLALASALMAVSHHLAMLVLCIYLLRLFGQGMMVHAAYTAAARWFSAQRGRALSVTGLGHNAGDAVMPILFVSLAAAIGWRGVWFAGAAALLLVALPLIAMLVAVPRMPSSSEPAARVVDARDWTRAEVLRDPLFYLSMLGFMAPGFIVTSAFFHQVHLVELRGWTMQMFASSFAVSAAVNSVFTIVCGQLIDRVSGVRMLPFVLLPLAAACIVLGLVSAPWGAFAFMALIGVSNGFSTTLFGAVVPEIYGLRHIGAIRALVVSSSVLASAAGPGVTGALIDAGIGFPGQLVAMGIYCLFACLVMGYVARRVILRNRD